MRGQALRVSFDEMIDKETEIVEKNIVFFPFFTLSRSLSPGL